MRRLTKWTASVFGAAGAGAGIAVARHRRRPEMPATPRAASAMPPAVAPVSAPTAPPDDPQAALDAARLRLRERADELRRTIESSDDPAGGA